MRYDIHKTAQDDFIEDICREKQLYYIQLPTFEKLKGKNKERKKLEQWLNFISYRDREAVKMAIKENDKVEKAERILKEILADDDLQEELRIREKHRMDYNNDMRSARKSGLDEGMQRGMKRGIKRGREQGIEQGRKETIIENAKAMLKEGLSIEFVERITKLDKKQIEKLAQAKV